MRLQYKMWTGADIGTQDDAGGTPAWKRSLELNANSRRN